MKTLGIIFSAMMSLDLLITPMQQDPLEVMAQHMPVVETKMDADPEDAWITPAFDKPVIEADEVIFTNVNEEILTVVKEPGPPMHLFGVCTITHYDNGPCCCGQWAGGHTASGTVPTANRTVAHNYLPFGTRVMINDQIYVVEDRGDANMAGGMWFDIYVNSHDEANARGMFSTEVYILDD
jgi:3D (Asp-Asp-Asp) domain-containing protein